MERKSTYLINNRLHHEDDTDFQIALSGAYSGQLPIQCVCKVNQDGDGQACYIAKLSSNDQVKFVVKRLPGSGSNHSSACEHYEINELLSGRSGLSKDAIVEDTESGLVNIKLKIPLNKTVRSSSSTQNSPNKDVTSAVNAKQSMLSLMGALHYLIESTGLNKWSPNMVGKRYYGLIRYLLTKQAGQTITKGERLSRRFFMPPSFTKEKIEENNRQYFAFVQSLQSTAKNTPLGLFVGQFKEFGSVLNFATLQVKHSGPKNKLLMDEKAVAAIHKKHQMALEMLSVYPELQLFFIATVVNFHDQLKVETIDFMLLTPEFLPLEATDHDWRLHKQLIEENRYFEKPLRFSLPVNKPLSSAVLTDVLLLPIALMFDCQMGVIEEPIGPTGELSNEVDIDRHLIDNENLATEATQDHGLASQDSILAIKHTDYKWHLPKSRTF